MTNPFKADSYRTSLTAGSVPFVGASGAIIQDNTAFFFDDTNNRLGVGTNAPAFPLDVNPGAIALRAGSTAGVSAAGTGTLRFNESTNKVQVSTNGGAYADVSTAGSGVSIGDTITSGVTNSILFVSLSGLTPILAQDPGQLCWDPTNNRFGLGISNPDYQCDLRSTALLTQFHIGSNSIGDAGGYLISAGTSQMIMAGGVAYVSGPGWVAKATEASILIQEAGGTRFYGNTGLVPSNAFTPTYQGSFTTDGGFELSQSSAAVSAADAARFKYNATTDYLQLSNEGRAYQTVATAAAVTLTDAATIATNAGLGTCFTVTLGGNRTMGSPTNLVAGQTYTWIVKQDGTGGRTLAWNAIFKWPGGTPPVITATAGAVDKIQGTYDGTSIFCTFAQNFS